jgi:hypothetical protein
MKKSLKVSKSRRSNKQIKIFWAGLDKDDLEDFRAIIKKAVKDPDYSIIANYEIHCEIINPPKKGDAPIRIIWSDVLLPEDVEYLKNEVEKALKDPDHVIVVNYEVHWEEYNIKR